MKSTKRQIILAGLVVALGVAVYLNWALSKKPEAAVDGAVNLGEVIYVGGTTVDGETAILTETAEQYFASARVSRQRTRDEAIQTMQSAIDSTEDQQVKLTAAEGVLKLAENIETEGRIENLVIAKGFADCMAFVDENTVSIVVATGENGLTAEQAAQIHDIAVSESDADVENIRIIEMK